MIPRAIELQPDACRPRSPALPAGNGVVESDNGVRTPAGWVSRMCLGEALEAPILPDISLGAAARFVQ